VASLVLNSRKAQPSSVIKVDLCELCERGIGGKTLSTITGGNFIFLVDQLSASQVGFTP
jgi:hypothetical protein